MTSQLARRIQQLPSSGIHAMMAYATKYPDAISLGQGTPTVPTPQFIYDGVFARAKSDDSVGMYASPKLEQELKDLLSQKFNQTYGFSPDTSSLVITSGAVAAITIALMAVINPGDEVIVFDPGYPLHLSQLHLVEGTPVFIPYEEENNWAFPINNIESHITSKTKAIILTNPNNPTGTILTQNQVNTLADIVIKHNLFLILDETYEYLSYGDPVLSPLTIEALRPNIILAKSFSKEFALTGWRIGYAYAQSPIAEKLRAIHTYLNIAAPSPSIVAGIIALSDNQGKVFMEETIRMYTETRTVLDQRMKHLSHLFSYSLPQGAYYLFPKLRIPMDANKFALQLIDEAHVITIPGDSMGPKGSNHIRMSFCVTPTIINNAFDRIDTFAKSHGYC